MKDLILLFLMLFFSNAIDKPDKSGVHLLVEENEEETLFEIK